jgi:hypothetical protein
MGSQAVGNLGPVALIPALFILVCPLPDGTQGACLAAGLTASKVPPMPRVTLLFKR